MPVSVSTATRKACTSNAMERISPPPFLAGGDGARTVRMQHPVTVVDRVDQVSEPDQPIVGKGAVRMHLDVGGIDTGESARSPPTRMSRSARQAPYTAFPATVVPAEANAPVSCGTASVSPPCHNETRPGSVDSAVATICVWTVVVPLPNSQVPTPT